MKYESRGGVKLTCFTSSILMGLPSGGVISIFTMNLPFSAIQTLALGCPGGPETSATLAGMPLTTSVLARVGVQLAEVR